MLQASATDPVASDVAVGIPVYPPVGVPGAAAAAQMHSLAETAPPPHSRGPAAGAQHSSQQYHPYDGLGASWPGSTSAARTQIAQHSADPAVPHGHNRSPPVDHATADGHAASMAEDVTLWQAKRGLTPVRTSPPTHAETMHERPQVTEISPAGGAGPGSNWVPGAHAASNRSAACRNNGGAASQRHVSWSGAPARRGTDELDSMHGRHAPALSWAGDSGHTRDRNSGRAEELSDAVMATQQLYRTNESDASGRGGPMEGHSGVSSGRGVPPGFAHQQLYRTIESDTSGRGGPMEGHSGKSSGRGIPPGLSAMNSMGTVSADENDGAGFNAGKLAEVAAIQVPLSPHASPIHCRVVVVQLCSWCCSQRDW